MPAIFDRLFVESASAREPADERHDRGGDGVRRQEDDEDLNDGRHDQKFEL